MNQTATVDPDDVAPEVEEDLELYKQQVALLEERAKTLTVTDDLTEAVALEFIAGAKRLYGDMEEKRDKRVRPHNTEVKKINDAYRPYTNVLDRLWRATDQARSGYLTKKQLAIEAANRKAIADAAEARRIEEAKAEAARQEAQRLRDEQERLEKEESDRLLREEMDRLAAEQKIKDEEEALARAKREGDARAAREAQETIDRAKREEEERARKAELDRLAALKEKNDLEKQAIKQDAKADIAESKATMVTPDIQVNESSGKRVLSDGSTAGSRKVVDWHFTNGMAKDKDYYLDDERLQGIPKRYWLLDLTKLGKDVKNGVPIEGTTRTEGSATTAGRK